MPSSAQSTAPPFGSQGEFVVSGSSVMAISWRWWDTSDAWAYALTIAPAADLFVFRNVSIGASLHFGYADTYAYGADGSFVETESTTLSGAVRAGVNVPIAKAVSWYPQLAAGLEFVESEEHLIRGQSLSVATSALGYPSSTQLGPWVELFAPLLFHPEPHFFLGAGPDFFHDFAHIQGGADVGGQRTTVGAGVVVGSWWGGSAAADDALPTAPPPPHRFGDAHEFVLSSESMADVYYTADAGVPSASSGFTIAPGVDYFVTNRVSVGVAFTIGSGHETGIDPSSRLAVSDDVVSGAGTLRLGVDVPISRWFSLYPRAGISAGVVSYDEKSNHRENKYSEDFVSVGVYVPLLLHVAPHAFIGFGPAVSRDLGRVIQQSSIENRTTSAGAGLMVGGWID